MPIVAWKQSAEFAANYLTKGRLVAIDGRLQIRSWVAQDGTRRKTAEVIAENLRSLDRPKEHSESAGGAHGVEDRMSDSHNVVAGEEFDDPFADE